jgi:hypothetical protein
MAHTPQTGQFGTPALLDADTQRAVSIKSNASAIASPSDGSLLIGGFDPVAALQRHIRVSPAGRLEVDVISGGGGGVTDTDDDSVAAGQTVSLNISMPYYFDRETSVWKRSAGRSDDDSVPISEGWPGGITLPYFSNLDAGIPGTWKRWTGRNDDGTLPGSDFHPTILGQTYGFNPSPLTWGRVLVYPDDDGIFPAQTTLLDVSLGYDFDGGFWRRSQALAASADAGFLAATLGKLVNARLGIVDEQGGAYARQDGLKDGIASAYVLQPRESGWPASRRGRRFVATHQTLGTEITAQTAFLATTPTFLMRQAASTRRIILRSIEIVQTNKPGSITEVEVVLDTADRFSAGGTAVTPQNVNEESAVASALTSFLFNPTATAAGAGTRKIFSGAYDNASFGGSITIDFKDAVIMGTTSSLLVYVVDTGGTAPAVKFNFEWEELP